MLKKVTELAKKNVSAETLAQAYLKEYFNDGNIVFPINPFQMLTDIDVTFVFRPFSKYEGVYIPAKDENDIPIIGINIKRPITRQRFTAAHELCHHVKDTQGGFMCLANGQSEIERYAENFAAELLMPSNEFRKQVAKYEKDGYIDFDGILNVANYFGVSFKSCLNKVAYRLHKVKGDTTAKALKKKVEKYKPANKRKEIGYNDVLLLEQLFDAMGKQFTGVPTDFACQKYKNEYVYYDSRMEGVDIDQETASKIVIDIRENKQNSVYCSEENKDIIEVAGLTFVYDYVFEKADEKICIYDTKHINSKLFSMAPYPDMGGRYRQSNTLVLGAKFETADYIDIPKQMMEIDEEIQMVLNNVDLLKCSEYIEAVVRIHHKLTVIHPFRDGNGRSTRAFLNMLLWKKNIPPVFFKEKDKILYKKALEDADDTCDYTELYTLFYKGILDSNVQFTNYRR